MSAITFDTHQLVKNLQSKGFTAEQAEGVNDALKGALTVAEVATKRDLKELELTFQQTAKELELRLTLRIGALVVASIAFMTALQKLLA